MYELGGGPPPRPAVASPHSALMKAYGEHLTQGGRLNEPSEALLTSTGLTVEQIASALAMRTSPGDGNPLGTTKEQWTAMLHDLRDGLAQAGLEGCAVGFSGSSINFYSSEFEPFPQTDSDLHRQADARRVDYQSARPLWQSVVDRLFGTSSALPVLHWFDSKRLIGLGRPSDLDFCLYHPSVDAAMAAFCQRSEIPMDEVVQPLGGGVFKVKYLRLAIPELADFTNRWSRGLARTGRRPRPIDITAMPYTDAEHRPECTVDLTDVVGNA